MNFSRLVDIDDPRTWLSIDFSCFKRLDQEICLFRFEKGADWPEGEIDPRLDDENFFLDFLNDFYEMFGKKSKFQQEIFEIMWLFVTPEGTARLAIEHPKEDRFIGDKFLSDGMFESITGEKAKLTAV